MARRSTCVRSTAWVGALLAGVLALSGCGSPGAISSASVTSTTTATATTAAPPQRPPQPAQPGWTVVTRQHGVIVADRHIYRAGDGVVVTIYRFHAGTVAYVLHAGSQEPPGVAAAVGASHGPALTRSELRRVVAVFNGGFKAAAGAGGFQVAGRTFIPLQRGLGSLVIDASGAAHVGVWGAGLPTPGEHVVAVRQNLQPLISLRRPSSLLGDNGAWGATLGRSPFVARSSLGQDRAGDLLFAASMHAIPADLAAALLAAGAVNAMQLDINPYWVGLDSGPHPGAALVAGIPDQERPGDQYAVGWTRDFVSVLASRV